MVFPSFASLVEHFGSNHQDMPEQEWNELFTERELPGWRFYLALGIFLGYLAGFATASFFGLINL